jgi:hypothetical protein
MPEENVPGCSPLDDDANPVTETEPYDPACDEEREC